jgi:hypothetical protein
MALFGDIAANTGFSQMTGTATNDDASAGNIGQIITTNVTIAGGIALTTATPANLGNISLTAGDWDVDCTLNIAYTSATQSGDAVGSISTVSATHDGNDYYKAYNNTRQVTTTSNVTLPLLRRRLSLSGTTTVYAVVTATFTAGTCKAFGTIYARRIR